MDTSTKDEVSEPSVRISRAHSLATPLAEGSVWEAEPGMWGRVANQRGVRPRIRDVYYHDDEDEAVEDCRKAVITLHELIEAASAGEDGQ